ncbi:uncharacterized protein PG986_004079 [Apiospora aurea]|uniref:F-box domain-containing protein n=1 Tax=Apiospora aurea TaxID=335848 RepID=A0ABR1QLK3_9PEZI
MTLFNRLPPELHLRVLGECTRGDMFSICLLSRRFHYVCTPLLYHTIDLSAHDGDYIDCMGGRGKKIRVPPDWVDRFECQDLDGALYKRQLRFLRTLHAKPALANHVMELHWTTVRIPYEVEETELALHVQPCAVEFMKGRWEWSETRLYFQLRREFHFGDCNSYLWDKLALMVHLKVIDIALMDAEERDAAPPPPSLLSSAQSIRLTGMASRHLIKSLLGSVEPAGLRHLYLNNLTEFAELCVIREDTTLREKRKTRPFPSTTSSQAGPMLTHLSPFIDRWPNLETLVIDIVGQPAPNSWGIPSEGTEEKRYGEIGAFIGSVASHLRVLHFQQGLNFSNHGFHRPGRCGGPTSPYPDAVRPMDSRFRRQILPANTRNTWPRLQRLELFGVASYTYSPNGESRVVNVPLSDADQDSIRRAVGDQVWLNIRADATRHFWVTIDYDVTEIWELLEENDTESDEDGVDTRGAEDSDE